MNDDSAYRAAVFLVRPPPGLAALVAWLAIDKLLVVLGMQLFALGLLGELIIFTHARDIKDYQIEEVVRYPGPSVGSATAPLPAAQPPEALPKHQAQPAISS